MAAVSKSAEFGLKDIKEHPPDILHLKDIQGQSPDTIRAYITRLKGSVNVIRERLDNVMSQQPQQQDPVEKEIASLKTRLDEHDTAIQVLSNYVDAQLAKGDSVETKLENLTRQVQDIALGTVTPRNTMSYRTALANGPKPANKKTDPEWNVATTMNEKETKAMIAEMDDFALNGGKIGEKPTIEKKCGVSR